MRHYSAYEHSKKKFNVHSSRGGGGFQSTGMYEDEDEDEDEDDNNDEYNEDASRGLGNSSDIMARWEKRVAKDEHGACWSRATKKKFDILWTRALFFLFFVCWDTPSPHCVYPHSSI